MEVSGQFHTSAAEKDPPVSIGYEGGWASGPVWTRRRTEKSLFASGNRTPAVQSVASHYPLPLLVVTEMTKSDLTLFNMKKARSGEVAVKAHFLYPRYSFLTNCCLMQFTSEEQFVTDVLDVNGILALSSLQFTSSIKQGPGNRVLCEPQCYVNA
jgi:hypothetical protein